MARPTKYDPKFLDTAAQMYCGGATDVEVADALGVSRSTLYNWQQTHPEFLDVAKVSKEAADTRVERSLYNRAVGYEFDSVKIFTYEGDPIVVPYREHVAPDPTAAFNWLKNRKPADWRDRREVTGAEGGPIETLVKVAFVAGKDDAT
jgi:Homeodomain-like domain